MKRAASGQLALIKNIPTEPGRSQEIGLKMSEYILQYHYGPIEDVISNSPDKASNVGNLTMKLPLHMDHQWKESPSGYLSFHCLAFDSCVQGGEQVYLNAFHEAELFRKKYPYDYAVLTKVQLPSTSTFWMALSLAATCACISPSTTGVISLG